MFNNIPVVETNTFKCGSAPSSNPSSPKRNRLKFLCSHGGKILPRPADGHLKYVGRETRVIAVPRDIPFQELVKKLTYMVDCKMILKYQVASEDLDTLISVKSNEDMRHMFEEIDGYETRGAPCLRAFLFPSTPLVADNHSVDPCILEQRYIDAIDGILRSPPLPTIKHHPPLKSTCSCPCSPESCTSEAITELSYQTNRFTNIHRVRSSPSLCSMNSDNSIVQQQNTHHNNHQLPPHCCYRPSHPKPTIDHYKGVVPDRMTFVRSSGRVESTRYHVDPIPQYYYANYNNIADMRMMNRMRSPVMSPVASSFAKWHERVGWHVVSLI